MDMTGHGNKVQGNKEQYYIRTRNVRSMNQGKLEVIKQEMARVNINTLGISELKWMETGKSNSDDHYMYHCGQESLRRNGVALIVNKRVQKRSTWVQSQKRQNDLCFQGKSFNIIVIQVYAPTTIPKKLNLNGSMKTYKTF